MSSPTTISKRHVIAVAFFGIALILTLRPWQSISPRNPENREALHGPAIADEASSVPPGLGESIRTKSRIRPHHAKPTIEETTALVRQRSQRNRRTESFCESRAGALTSQDKRISTKSPQPAKEIVNLSEFAAHDNGKTSKYRQIP